MLDIKEGIIVCSDDIKKTIIEEKNKNNSFFNATYFTLEKFEKKLFFDYKKRAIFEVCKKYSIKPQVAKNYLRNLTFLRDDVVTEEKLIFLKEIKDLLFAKDLLIFDHDFMGYLELNKVSFVGYERTTQLDNIINMIKDVTEVKYVDLFESINTYDVPLYKFSDVNQEVNFVFDQIQKLIDSKVSLNSIKLANINANYSFIVNRVASSYNFMLKTRSMGSLLDSDQMVYILEETLKYSSYKEALDSIKASPTLLNKVVDIVNAYEAFDLTPHEFYDILTYELSNTSFDASLYEEAIELIDFNTSYYNDNFHIFFLGFNNDCLRIHKDEDFLSDKTKEELKVNTSLDMNKEIKNMLIKRLKTYKNISLTYTNHLTFGEVLKSNLIDDLDFIKLIDKEDNVYFNEVETKLVFGQLLDDYFSFNMDTPLLKDYYYNNFLYKTYDNRFKGLNLDSYKEHQGDVIKLSYSSLNEYDGCAFKYYVNRILKIDSFEDSMAARLGTFAHDILMHSYDSDFNFNIAKDDGMKDVTSNKEKFYFNQVAKIIEQVIEFNKSYEELSKLKDIQCEPKIEVVYHDGKLLFEGLIDKIITGEVKGKTLALIIDYKTSEPKISIPRKYKETGMVDLEDLNLQLLVYSFLVNKSQMFNNVQVIGMYLQKIGPTKYKHGSKTMAEQLNAHLTLDGYSIKKEEYLSELGPIFNGNYIKSLKQNKNGSIFNYHAKVLTEEVINAKIDDVEQLILRTYEQIKSADFSINPKKKGSLEACQFCQYANICFKTFNDYRIIENADNDEGSDTDVY